MRIISGSESFWGRDHFGSCTVPALSVYFKGSFNEKMESYTKPTFTLPNFKEPPIISYKKGKSLKDMLVRAKIQKVNTRFYASMDVQPVTPCILSQIHTYVLTGSLLVKSLNYS